MKPRGLHFRADKRHAQKRVPVHAWSIQLVPNLVPRPNPVPRPWMSTRIPDEIKGLAGRGNLANFEVRGNCNRGEVGATCEIWTDDWFFSQRDWGGNWSGVGSRICMECPQTPWSSGVCRPITDGHCRFCVRSGTASQVGIVVFISPGWGCGGWGGVGCGYSHAFCTSDLAAPLPHTTTTITIIPPWGVVPCILYIDLSDLHGINFTSQCPLEQGKKLQHVLLRPVYTCDFWCDFWCDFAYETRPTLPCTNVFFAKHSWLGKKIMTYYLKTPFLPIPANLAAFRHSDTWLKARVG